GGEIIGNTRVDLRKRGLLAAISVTKSTDIFVHEISTVFYDLSATITVFKSWIPLESVSTIQVQFDSRSPNLPVIPVLLPDCEPPLGFLRQLTWVDLRTQALDLGIAILAKAARGEL